MKLVCNTPLVFQRAVDLASLMHPSTCLAVNMHAHAHASNSHERNRRYSAPTMRINNGV